MNEEVVEPVELKPAPRTVQRANVTIVRNDEGELQAFVEDKKILGVVSITMNPLQTGGVLWSINLLGANVRLSELLPIAPSYEYADNVVGFPGTKVEPPDEDKPVA